MSGNELAQLGDALDAVASIELGSLSRSGMRTLVLGMESARTRFEAVSAKVLAAFDANGDWTGEAARSAASWLKAHTGTARVDAGSRVWLAGRLRLMPLAAGALDAGEITMAHVRLLARGLGPRTRAAFAEADGHLLDEARRLDADRFAKVIEHWIDVVDPNGPPPRSERPDELYASETLSGRVVGRFDLSRETGIAFLEALRAKTDELLHRDKKLREVDPTDKGFDSTPANRRARALLELMEKGFAAGDPVRRQAAATLIIDERTLAGFDAGPDAVHETMFGSVVPLGLLHTWLCDSDVGRLVMSAEGVPLEMGRLVRTATPAQRRALMARDRGCAFPGCDCSGNFTDAHHIEWWERGGKTDLENLVGLCRYHHRRVHAGEITVRMIDGLPHFFLPDGTELREPERAAA
jgi:hypothetical protein